MKIEQFREIADENLQDLTVDERMLQMVHQKMLSVSQERRPAVPKRAFTLAAACIAVMLISGGVLFGTMDMGKSPSQQLSTAVYTQPANSASTLAADAHTSMTADGTVLSYGIESVGEFCGGYAPALATNGLYGVVNEEHAWVVKALYEEVAVEENGKVVVKTQDIEQIIEIGGK